MGNKLIQSVFRKGKVAETAGLPMGPGLEQR